MQQWLAVLWRSSTDVVAVIVRDALAKTKNTFLLQIVVIPWEEMD